MTARVNVTANRMTPSWSNREMLARVLWAAVTPLFRCSPRPLWGWRRALLRLFGAQIGGQVHVYPTVRITMPWHLRIGDQTAIGDCATLYALGPVHIGARVTISQNAHLCAGTHDRHRADRPLVKSPIWIGDDAWVCADAFVGPGVTIGAAAVLGARAVAMRDLDAGSVGYGNPMQVRAAS
jgi:putative colanic acid biosynthesis acetyltransferase WcaF